MLFSTVIKTNIHVGIFLELKLTYCKARILHHNVQKNIHKKLPARDTGGTSVEARKINLFSTIRTL